MDAVKTALLKAALPHVAFDGWGEASFRAAAADAGLDAEAARTACPRGALDLAVAYHKAGDDAMRAAVAATPFVGARVRERITFAVRSRIEAGDREVVRRGTVLFALPLHAAEGAGLIWGTADAIWEALGDPSDDINWYSKRAILSGVYGSVVLFWLGDDSEGAAATWDFLDRRIEDVMRIEQVKGQLRANPLTKGPVAAVESLLSRVKAPSRTPRDDLPGRWRA
ncbi:hypothetical protein AIOL_000116 [Candidatus Rhodobacter oscarellae]|uniref:COQ9 C-terminal domain-containing protein n=1 Tax=Candidatus Rhodobacter oscarellae TaxID=1675527 RepID=A0A0J9EB15_9RHOB|nr:COQ9 family protein [Candidatus Rhodobacter lobularis]KMW59967.1 hypothetical protein AIOL_000116 [Candidatus Rhodobacter lobularis]